MLHLYGARDKIINYLKMQMNYHRKYTIDDFAKECGVKREDVLNMVYKKLDLVSYAAVMKMMDVADSGGLIFFD